MNMKKDPLKSYYCDVILANIPTMKSLDECLGSIGKARTLTDPLFSLVLSSVILFSGSTWLVVSSGKDQEQTRMYYFIQNRTLA